MTWEYPAARRSDVSDILHGVRVEDPYRYLENTQDAETLAFVDAQNALSAPYLAALPVRGRFLASATAALTAPRFGVPFKRGENYFVTANPGDLEQDRVLTAKSLPELLAGGRVLLDPNTLAADGTIALAGMQVSPNGGLLGYALAEAGSDWVSLHVQRVSTGEMLPDVIRWCKWTVPEWLPDSSGFVYWSYRAPIPGAELTAAMGAGVLKMHRLGTAVEIDPVIWSPPEQEWMVAPHVSSDGRWLLLTQAPGTDSRTLISALRIGPDKAGMLRPTGELVCVIDELADAHTIVEAEGDILLLRTEAGAERGRLVKLDLQEPEDLFELIPEHERDVLVSAHRVADGILVVWSHDAAHRLELFDLHGFSHGCIPIDEPVSIAAVTGQPGQAECFVTSTSFTRSLRSHRLVIGGGCAELTHLPAPAGAPVLDAVASRVHAVSSDGTEVPMTVLRRSDLPPGPRPTLLYGYGGFDIPVLPAYSAMFASWVQAGGVLAVANLRGGGEFGAAWHQDGMKEHKQRVFDDAIACAEFLIAEGVTGAHQLAVHGRSNGGLLVGAMIVQRPDLFAAALPTVGVLDMLRFHLFTIGWAWTSDYGDPEVAEEFAYLHAYSPLHQLRTGRHYPATLICTGDHDDRVVPAHSLKFGAQLQFCQSGDSPVLLRIDTRAGHGAGKPAHALAAEYADQLAFAAEHTGLEPHL
ncbi:S9 family peptidase [Nakamurella antarctica]|uniref:prolyl oligopeptidase n=1 Tax=Nakamurella antarctica TaxID=1902245 RepID=A0A3G8ZL01_9ACTN|nr:prolyl oligopeptidase family serine peptidase [Nakamurella antarctica]AZI57923.1 S9 family peptidase [Nakamurella antarctica]